MSVNVIIVILHNSLLGWGGVSNTTATKISLLCHEQNNVCVKAGGGITIYDKSTRQCPAVANIINNYFTNW